MFLLKIRCTVGASFDDGDDTRTAAHVAPHSHAISTEHSIHRAMLALGKEMFQSSKLDVAYKCIQMNETNFKQRCPWTRNLQY